MFIYLVGLSAALAMDCFSVSLGMNCGSKRLTRSQALRLASFFGGFQFAMPLLGWLAGRGLIGLIERFDHWVAFGLLVVIGGRMVKESFSAGDGDEVCRTDRTRGIPLLVLSVATSVDALAVGLSLGVIGLPVLLTAAVIGAGSFLLTLAGARLGPLVGGVIGRRAELFGGLILIGIGVKILVEHLRG